MSHDISRRLPVLTIEWKSGSRMTQNKMEGEGGEFSKLNRKPWPRGSVDWSVIGAPQGWGFCPQ